MNANDYKIQHNILMDTWEKEVRQWISDEIDVPIATTFFKDGIIDPETWFNNKFRPLFILKEVHDKSQENRCINFVAMEEGNDYDIWQRKGMWHAFGTLAKGIISSVESKGKITSYEELYKDSIEKYRDTLRQIAIINVKKLSGGNRVDSDTSIETKHFTCHARKFADKLKQQIELIKPSIIICCGSEVKDCFEVINCKIYGIPTVMGLHPATNPNRRRSMFYDDTIKELNRMVLK